MSPTAASHPFTAMIPARDHSSPISTACSALCAWVRRAILHLRDLRVRVVRVLPVVVRCFVLPLLVQPGNARLRRVGVWMPLSLASRVRKSWYPSPGVMADNRAHRRIGLQRRRIHPHRLAVDHPMIGQHFEDELKNFRVRLDVDQSPRPPGSSSAPASSCPPHDPQECLERKTVQSISTRCHAPESMPSKYPIIRQRK